MLTKEDKSWMVTSFVTRGEHHTDMSRIEENYSRIEKKVDEVLNKLDKFVGTVDTLQRENQMGARVLHRHNIQIHELATATGTALSE